MHDFRVMPLDASRGTSISWASGEFVLHIDLVLLSHVNGSICGSQHYKIKYNNETNISHQLFRTPDPKLNVVGIVGQNRHSVANSPYRCVASAFSALLTICLR